MPGTRPGMTEIVATILAHSSSEIVSEQHATNAITALAACDISLNAVLYQTRRSGIND